MKRVKCYGRMKAVHIDEKIKKVFSDDDDSVLNLSAGERHGKQNFNIKRNRECKGKNYFCSPPPLFAALSDSLNSDEGANNVENLPPKVKAKRKQGKPKVKKTAPKKKCVKRNNVKKITEGENIPNFSLIAEHTLYVEKNTNGNKRECSQPPSNRSKHVCLTSTESSSEHDEYTCASNLSLNEIMPKDALIESDALKSASNTREVQDYLDKTTETKSTDQEDCNDDLPNLQYVNIRSFKSMKQINSLHNNLFWNDILCSPLKLPECLDNHKNSFGTYNELSREKLQETLSRSIRVPDVNLVEKNSLDQPIVDGSALPTKLVDKHVPNLALSLETCAQVNVKDSKISNDSDLSGLVSSHSSGSKELTKNNSFLEAENPSNSKSRKNEEHSIHCPDKQHSFSFDSGVSPSKTEGIVLNSTPVVKERKFGNPFPSPDISRITRLHLLSSSKSSVGARKFKLVTSTPSVQTMKPFKGRLPQFNLSHISVSEKVNSCFAKSKSHALSPLCNRNVSNFNKSRSLTVLYDASKLINKPSKVGSLHQMQFASDTNKSRTCTEKVASKMLSTSLDLHESLAISEKLLELCGQESVIPIASVYDWSLTKIKKIGEGTYGEVFMLSQKKPSVIKIIPISQDDTNTWLNLESVYSEVKVSYCLSALRKNKFNKTSNFSKVNRVHFVKGSYPKQLIKAWDTFSVAKSTYNIRPDCFNNDQLYVILDLEYGGKDMTCFEMKNATEAESILKQITISLAIAEETHLFEHRDLHLGNILVQKVKKKSISYVLGGKPLSVPSHGVMVTIIDFTLSRVFDAGCVYFHNLADDESLFNQTGDLQFEIYRATREHLQNQWHDCALYSNVLWLTFLCVKMKEYKYTNPTSKAHLKSLNDIEVFQKGLKQCQSALDSLKLSKLTTAMPTNSSIGSLQMKKTKFVDRKSLQKSKTNLRN